LLLLCFLNGYQASGWMTLSHDPPTTTFLIAGITVVYHHALLFEFCPGRI
jgi:hypothetical protein